MQKGPGGMNDSQLAYKSQQDDKRWKDTLKDICEVARLCLHNLVGSNTPPLPRCYEQEFEQAALHLGKNEVLDMVRVDSERQAVTMRTAILKASERIGQARVFLKNFDKDARKELGRMERHLDILNSHLKLMDENGLKEVVDTALSFKNCSNEFVQELSLVIENITRQQNMLQELVQKVHEDPLTGVLNRRAWERDLQHLSCQSQEGGPPYYCIVIADLDNFKDINDKYGHPVGDAVLRQFALLLKEHFSDLGAVYRYGGDEFTVIVQGYRLDFVRKRLEDLRNRLASALFVAMGGKIKIRLSASFGLSEGSSDTDVKKILENADEMLYVAKKSGRDCIKCSSNGQ